MSSVAIGAQDVLSLDQSGAETASKQLISID